MTWLRALAAAGLSVFMPGAGHALIRDWLRALVFAGLYISAILLFFPTEQIAAAGSISDAMDIATSETDTISQFVLSFLVLFAAIDATFRAMGFPPGSNNGESVEGPSCPECGKELDADLEFCHWCTTRIEPVEPESESADADQSEREEPTRP
ncbi:zinc ribbon domain-containing protein [Natronorubrum sp. JWXQ-INN-674]|uniref:Zinc ribbon domain-containing protein n=1 Tax=Natronorubrum halalkaliphilum TaxID=2691917 RepID=A0A6B0VGC6_9EURY|nr:zinc ribbon domain-containing protein [Natronorubrum halalkaliphilum]MXV60831.1 zinc ribbon domain-containing protein [Natronorubrum halalkaliphilum]